MSASYEHLGVYSDWVATAAGPRARATRPGREEVRRLASEILAVPSPQPQPRPWRSTGGAALERRRARGRGDLLFRRLRPAHPGLVLKPAGAAGRLPGVLALHGHNGFKY